MIDLVRKRMLDFSKGKTSRVISESMGIHRFAVDRFMRGENVSLVTFAKICDYFGFVLCEQGKAT